MSTSTDPTISDFAASVTFNYCSISIITLLTYYYLTTLSQELKYYNRKFSVATLLYITNRYVPLANALYAAPWLVYSGSEQICAAQVGVLFTLENLQYFPWAIFSALRTYALHRKLYSAIMVLVMSLSTVIISSVREHWLVISDHDDGNGQHECTPTIANSLPVWYPYFAPAAARVPMVIADLITIVITWKTQHRTYSLGKKLPASFILTTVLLRDGTIYFVVLTILNILLLAFDYHQVFANDPINVSYLVNFAEPITSILISDFLTNLREAADNLASGPESQVSVDTLEFRIIGSIGASLRGGSEWRTCDPGRGGDRPAGDERRSRCLGHADGSPATRSPSCGDPELAHVGTSTVVYCLPGMRSSPLHWNNLVLIIKPKRLPTTLHKRRPSPHAPRQRTPFSCLARICA